VSERDSLSSLKGKIVATLIGITCAEGSDGQINFASPFVDDEGIDLIFFRKGGTGKAILVQVKGRTTESELLKRGTFRAQVRRSSFKPREGYYFIFAAFDKLEKKLRDTLWLVPSKDLDKKLQGRKTKKY
jgi:hypothetical protein